MFIYIEKIYRYKLNNWKVRKKFDISGKRKIRTRKSKVVNTSIVERGEKIYLIRYSI